MRTPTHLGCSAFGNQYTILGACYEMPVGIDLKRRTITRTITLAAAAHQIAFPRRRLVVVKQNERQLRHCSTVASSNPLSSLLDNF
jgi:hypothetical protein